VVALIGLFVAKRLRDFGFTIFLKGRNSRKSRSWL
jgi:hypothetical protein